MAGHLLRAGHDLTVWSRTPARAEPLRAQGAVVVGSLQELGDTCDIVMLCVTRTEDVQQCLEDLTTGREGEASASRTPEGDRLVEASPFLDGFGDRLAEASPSRGRLAGKLFIDHTTILPKAAAEMHRWLTSMGHRFVDAPITGGSMGAQKGQLTIFCGGDEATIDEAKPYLSAYAKRAERVGGPGTGQMMKMANQIAVGGALMALCESLAFAKKAGLDLAQTRELLSGGAAGSWAFENYGPKILAEDWSPGFSISNQVKDFEYCLETAVEIDAAIPGTALVDELLQEMIEDGDSGATTAALYKKLLEMNA